MQLILRISTIMVALLIGFGATILNDGSQALVSGSPSAEEKHLPALAPTNEVPFDVFSSSPLASSAPVDQFRQNGERERVDALAHAVSAVRQELEATKEQTLLLEQEHQRAISMTVRLAQELAAARQELEATKGMHAHNPATSQPRNSNTFASGR
jgi:hypothetical protein